MCSRLFQRIICKKHLDTVPPCPRIPLGLCNSHADVKDRSCNRNDKHKKTTKIDKSKKASTLRCSLSHLTRKQCKSRLRHERSNRSNTCCIILLIIFILVFFYYSLLSTYVTKNSKNRKCNGITNTYKEMYKASQRTKEVEKMALKKCKNRRPRIKEHLINIFETTKKYFHFLFVAPQPYSRYHKNVLSKRNKNILPTYNRNSVIKRLHNRINDRVSATKEFITTPNSYKILKTIVKDSTSGNDYDDYEIEKVRVPKSLNRKPQKKPICKDQPNKKPSKQEQPNVGTLSREQSETKIINRERPKKETSNGKQPKRNISEERPKRKPLNQEQPERKTLGQKQDTPSCKTSKKLVNQESITREPINRKPTNQKPMNRKPMNRKPMNRKPTNEKPIDQKLMKRKTINREPVKQDKLESKSRELLNLEPRNQKPSSRPPSYRPSSYRSSSYRPSSNPDLPDCYPSDSRHFPEFIPSMDYEDSDCDMDDYYINNEKENYYPKTCVENCMENYVQNGVENDVENDFENYVENDRGNCVMDDTRNIAMNEIDDECDYDDTRNIAMNEIDDDCDYDVYD